MVTFGLVFNLLIRLDFISSAFITPAQVELIKSGSVLLLAISFISMLIRLIGGILLFILKKTALYLLVADACIQTISMIVATWKGFNVGNLEHVFCFSAMFVWIVSLAIACYSWSLYKRGFLR